MLGTVWGRNRDRLTPGGTLWPESWSRRCVHLRTSLKATYTEKGPQLFTLLSVINILYWSKKGCFEKNYRFLCSLSLKHVADLSCYCCCWSQWGVCKEIPKRYLRLNKRIKMLSQKISVYHIPAFCCVSLAKRGNYIRTALKPMREACWCLFHNLTWSQCTLLGETPISIM